MPANKTITTEEKVPVILAPNTKPDGTGNPAPVDGPIRVTVKSGDSTFTQDPAEPMMFYAVSSDTPGDTVFTIEADADLGAGVVLISDEFTLNVISATARSLGMIVGEAEPK